MRCRLLRFIVANTYDHDDGVVTLDIMTYDTMFTGVGERLDAIEQLER